MAGDKMAAEFITHPQRSFQVDAGADVPGAQLGMSKGFGGGIDGEPVRAEFNGGKAAAGAGNGCAERHGWVGEKGFWCLDNEAHVVALGDRVDGSDAAE